MRAWLAVSIRWGPRCSSFCLNSMTNTYISTEPNSMRAFYVLKYYGVKDQLGWHDCWGINNDKLCDVLELSSYGSCLHLHELLIRSISMKTKEFQLFLMHAMAIIYMIYMKKIIYNIIKQKTSTFIIEWLLIAKFDKRVVVNFFYLCKQDQFLLFPPCWTICSVFYPVLSFREDGGDIEIAVIFFVFVLV